MGNSIDLEVVITAVDEASAKLASIQKSAQQLGKQFTVVGGLLAGGLAVAVKSASDAQTQMAKVDATLNAMGDAGKNARAEILRVADATLKLGFDNEESAVAMSLFYQRTNNVADAQKLLAVSMDLARAKNIDLTTATKLVTQSLSGGGKVLKQYGIDIKETASPMEALGILQEKVGGQAQAFSQTFAGASESLKQQVGELTEKIGAQLLPVLTNIAQRVTPFVEKILAWTEAHPQLTQNIIIATGALAGLLLVLGPIMLLFSAISAPMLIVAGVIGVIAYGVFELVKNWGTLQPVMMQAWETMKGIGAVVMDFLKPAFDILIVGVLRLWEQLKALWAVLSPLLMPVLKWLGIFLGATLVAGIAILVASIGGLMYFLSGLVQGLTWVIAKAKELYNWFATNLPGGLKIAGDAWNSMWNGMKSIATSVIDYVMKKIQKMIDLYNSAKDAVSSVGGKVSSAKDSVVNAVKGLVGKAGGGQVVAGQSYIVGEKGQEVFTPSQSGSIIPNNKLGGSGNITVNINGGTYLSEDVARQIGDKIISQFRRTVRI